jgi:hypothetical protein
MSTNSDVRGWKASTVVEWLACATVERSSNERVLDRLTLNLEKRLVSWVSKLGNGPNDIIVLHPGAA